MQPCEKNSQCGANQCCALQLRFLGYKGYCFRMKSLGEMCSPSVRNGKHFTCGCRVGLTCAITDLDRNRNPKFRCVRIPTETPEIAEKQSFPVNDSPQNSMLVKMFTKYLRENSKRLNRLRTESRRPKSS
eukprot:Seg2072.2 transcript_id=Seg2072.2/GoldUCD/mRNA.D3Y31 product="hypothetical protein" protein_id=Seg2072.2/GoldUCD/D3Y31